MPNPLGSIPRLLMVSSNLFYSVGAFLADWSETHVLNPRWPPHARFHNGQTMSLGVLLASVSFYLLSRPQPTKSVARDSVFLAAVVGSLYCIAGLSAIAYPGTDWVDPEFKADTPPAIQLKMFSAQVVVMWIGALWEMARIGNDAKAGMRKSI